MELIYLLLPLSLLLAACAVAGFVWAVRAGQFDDLTTPAWRILFDEPERGQTGIAAAAAGPEPCPVPGPAGPGEPPLPELQTTVPVHVREGGP